MDAHARTPWPTTYLGRLQAVATEVNIIGAPASAGVVADRFTGVTVQQVEAILAALVLFGRLDKNDDLYSVVKE